MLRVLAIGIAVTWTFHPVDVRAAGSFMQAKATNQDGPPLNFLFVLLDDLGWSDFACYGSDLHETPHIDRLAQQGIRFTSAYASAPVCTPTRAAIMTGQHPARLHMTIWREGALNPPLNNRSIPPVTVEDLPHEQITIAERLKDRGYFTASIGKWHLGGATHYPETQGFDVNIGGTMWGCPPTFFYPYRGVLHKEFRYVPGLGAGHEGEYLTDRLTDQALAVIDQAGKQPFFVYLAHYAPHYPIEARQELIQRYTARLRPGLRHGNATYAAMIHSIDESIGRLLKHLDERGLADHTVVILTSDNGGFIGKWGPFPHVTNNAPLRSGKGSLYEGGIRVPLIVRCPQIDRPGRVCQEPVVLTDSLPTIAELAALAPISCDGRSWVPLLRSDGGLWGPRTLCWHYPHYYETTTPVSAIRSGDWKLLQYLEDCRLELYNLRDDPGEQTDLAQRVPQIREDLLGQLRVWRKEVDAQMPTVNPKCETR